MGQGQIYFETKCTFCFEDQRYDEKIEIPHREFDIVSEEELKEIGERVRKEKFPFRGDLKITVKYIHYMRNCTEAEIKKYVNKIR